MPNGRSGGFWIARSKLEGMLDDLARDCKVGILGMTNATAHEVTRVLSKQDRQREKIPVEEQDHLDYIVHLGGIDPVHGFDGMSTWLSVGAQSPLYPSLRRYHSERAMKRAVGRGIRRPARILRN